MKRKQPTKRPLKLYASFAVLAVIFYLVTTTGMSLIEQERQRELQMTQYFIETINLAKTPEEREHLLALYHKITLDKDTHIEDFIEQSQDLIDTITPGTEYCQEDSDACGVYHDETVQNIKELQEKIPTIQGTLPPITITPLDHLLKLFTLVIESLVPSALLDWLFGLIKRL